MEVLRDIVAEYNLNEQQLIRFVTVHEVGHQFQLRHAPGIHVMASPGSYDQLATLLANPIQFSMGDLRKIREEVPNNDPYHP